MPFDITIFNLPIAPIPSSLIDFATVRCYHLPAASTLFSLSSLSFLISHHVSLLRRCLVTHPRSALTTSAPRTFCSVQLNLAISHRQSHRETPGCIVRGLHVVLFRKLFLMNRSPNDYSRPQSKAWNNSGKISDGKGLLKVASVFSNGWLARKWCMLMINDFYIAINSIFALG